MNKPNVPTQGLRWSLPGDHVAFNWQLGLSPNLQQERVQIRCKTKSILDCISSTPSTKCAVCSTPITKRIAPHPHPTHVTTSYCFNPGKQNVHSQMRFLFHAPKFARFVQDWRAHFAATATDLELCLSNVMPTPNHAKHSCNIRAPWPCHQQCVWLLHTHKKRFFLQTHSREMRTLPSNMHSATRNTSGQLCAAIATISCSNLDLTPPPLSTEEPLHTIWASIARSWVLARRSTAAAAPSKSKRSCYRGKWLGVTVSQKWGHFIHFPAFPPFPKNAAASPRTACAGSPPPS